MKRKIGLFFFAALFLAAPAWAQYTGSQDSGGLVAPMTSSGIAVSGPVAITQILAETDGTNSVTIAVWNNTAASGDKVTEWTCAGAAPACAEDWKTPRYCGKGLYISITTSGTARVFPEWVGR